MTHDGTANASREGQEVKGRLKRYPKSRVPPANLTDFSKRIEGLLESQG